MTVLKNTCIKSDRWVADILERKIKAAIKTGSLAVKNKMNFFLSTKKLQNKYYSSQSSMYPKCNKLSILWDASPPVAREIQCQMHYSQKKTF